MVLCHYDGILKSEEEGSVYIGGERRVVLIDNDATFEHFESKKRLMVGCGSSPIKVIYLLKCEAMSICADVPVRRIYWSCYTFMIFIMPGGSLYM